jgi:hypothetical protein
MTAPVYPIGGPRRRTNRVTNEKTVAGVKLVRCGAEWRPADTWIGIGYNETERVWDVLIPGGKGFYARTLKRAVEALLARGLVEKAVDQ